MPEVFLFQLGVRDGSVTPPRFVRRVTYRDIGSVGAVSRNGRLHRKIPAESYIVRPTRFSRF